ncbi:MAG: MarR family winged helix-turn-helix transcriptional regulator [Thermoleophilaceae bacterium]
MSRAPNDGPRVNLGRLLLSGFRWFDDGLRRNLAAQGWPPISSGQSLVFAYLDPGGTTISELGRRIGVSRQAVHQMTTALAAAGLVELRPCPGDARSKLVVLTAEGRRSVPAALAIFDQLEELLAARIGKRRAADLRVALEADWGSPADLDDPGQ